MCRKETNSGENILAPAAIGKECWWAGLGGVGRREGGREVGWGGRGGGRGSYLHWLSHTTKRTTEH